MSDGHYCIVREVGPVKRGEGLKHHKVIVDFTGVPRSGSYL